MARTVEEGHVSRRRAAPARISACTCPTTLGGYSKQFPIQQLSALLQIPSGSDCPRESLFKIDLNSNTRHLRQRRTAITLLSVSSTQSFGWNLECINIWSNGQFIWSRKVYIRLSVWEFKNLCLWQPCLNKRIHVENCKTDHLQHYLYVSISYKFTLAWVFVSHACTQI